MEHVQLLSLSAICLVGVGFLAARRRQAGRPRRRSLALLIDSFALGLVMIAVLFVVGTFDGPAFREIQRATLVVIGISPIVFLLGLLDARLARSAVGDLIVELRADPAPADLRDALARALRDPSLALAYWLPDFETYVDLEGRAVELPATTAGRTTTSIDRDGAHVAALLHDRALDDEPELLDAVSAAAGIALENGRLHAELRARLEELKGSRARVIEAGQTGAPAAGAQPPRRRPAAAGRALARAQPARGAARRRPGRARRGSTRRGGRSRCRSRSCATSPAGSIRRCSAGTGSAVALESLVARAPVPVRL